MNENELIIEILCILLKIMYIIEKILQKYLM